PGGIWDEYNCNGSGGSIDPGMAVVYTPNGGPPPPPPPPPPGQWDTAAPYPQSDVRYAFAQSGEDHYVIRGVSDGTRINAVNKYNATTDSWTPLAPIPVASEAPCGAMWNGKIYVAEGDTGSSFQIYDIATNTWSAGPPRPGFSNGYGCAAGAGN